MPTLADEAAALFGAALTPEHERQFAVYARELAAWNAHTNLTAIIEARAVEVRHFLDSLSVLRVVTLRPGLRVIDVGTGAGFPGLPLALIDPTIQVTLLEATGKKVVFLDHLVNVFSLDNVTTLHARAEEAGQMPAHRAAYDVALARAVARLPILLEYLLPLVKVGGLCVAMKGKTAEEEARDSTRALAKLGGRLRGIEPIQLPGLEETHYLVVVEKLTPTAPVYPRRPGIPGSKPL